MPSDLQRFAEDLRQEVMNEARLEGAETLRLDAFARRMIQELTEVGEFDDGDVAYFKARGMEVSGYSIGDEGTRLDVLATVHTQSTPPRTVPKSQVETAITRALGFIEKARTDLVYTLEESTPAFDMALAIHDMERLEAVRVFVATDGLATVKARPPEMVGELKVSYHVWDIKRLYQAVTSGQQQESIDIDFLQMFGEALPCVVAPQGWADYSTHLAIVPGPVLAQIYDEYGTRLLERNVRAFLQTRGKVNQGIRNTILNEPERFLAYNNGISATASGVTVAPIGGGGVGITRITDLQIVNGGQTTASIHHVARREKADVSHIFVPAKLTVLPPEKLNEIVPLISRYANSQNKVNEADFAANDPFHVQVETWSRTVWAPAVGGQQQQTRWFYERARGQYQDAITAQITPARKKAFKVLHPTNQKFTKTDLAKFENTWDQLPHIVSLGAEKNFRHFTIRLAQRAKFRVTQVYFERLIAKAILFRRAERIVSQQQFGGYRANIVTYTLAYISNASAQQIDLDAIWDNQDLTPALSDAIESISHEVREVLLDAPGSGNVTEWCKKAACWEAVRQLAIPLPRAIRRELVNAGHDPWRMTEAVSDVLQHSTRPLGKAAILQRARIPEETWNPTIRTLLAQGRVVKQGDRRGATYTWTD